MKLTIRWKLVLAIGLPLLLIYASILTASLIHLRKRSFHRLEEIMSRLASQYAARVEARVHAVEEIARTAAATTGLRPDTAEQELHSVLQSIIDLDEMVHGVRFVFRSEPPSDQVHVHYAYRSAGGIISADLDARARESGSHILPWYDRALDPETGSWSDPHQDEASGQTWVSSYTVALMAQGRRVGVVAVDVSILELRRHIGEIDIEGGDFMILGRDGTILSHPVKELILQENLIDLAQQRNRPDVADVGRRMIRGEKGMVRIASLLKPEELPLFWVFYAPIRSPGWSFSIGVPETEILAFSNSQMKIAVTFMAGGLVLILAALLFVSGRITRPLLRLATAVGQVSEGDLEVQVPGKVPQDEVGDLTLAFNKMVTDLKEHTEALKHETAAREAVESELRVARKIQTSLLPQTFPPFPEHKEFDLHAINLSAHQVAGDFFDFFFTPEGSLIIIMADVAGKGVPAALFMAVSRTIFRNACGGGRTPAEILSIANQTLCKDNLGSLYVTLFLSSYEIKTGKLRYANAGHPLPYRISSDGIVSPFGEVTGTVVGIMKEARYQDRLESLAPGEKLILFTDGIPEAVTMDDEFYGDERLVAFLERHASEPVDRLCQMLVDETDAFQGMERKDDTTVMALKRN